MGAWREGGRIAFLHLCLGEAWCGVEEGLEGNRGGVLLWRKESAPPGLFSEKVTGTVNFRALPIVISLRNLVPET